MNYYEALGHYIEATEKLEILKLQRKAEIRQADAYWRDLNFIKYLNDITALPLLENAVQNMELILEKYKKINQDMVELLHQINRYADICGRPTFEIKTH